MFYTQILKDSWHRVSGRVIFAACWPGMPKKAFEKIATPCKKSFGAIFQTIVFS